MNVLLTWVDLRDEYIHLETDARLQRFSVFFY